MTDWHDINSPGWLPSSKKGQPDSSVATADDTPPPQKQSAPKEYRITSVKAVEPAQGFELNKPFDIEGEVEQIADTITQPRVLLYPIGRYNNKEDQFVPGGIEAFIDSDTLGFCCTCKYLFNPQPYDDDTGKSADATWDLVVRANGATAKELVESDPLTFPQPSKFVELKKHDYDENGADRYNVPQSGENYKPNGVVKSLQGDLITTGFLPKDSDDGSFGEQTDSAVREFQKFAIKNERMQRKIGKVETTDKVLEQPQPDGIVGKKTRDELDRWLQKDWVKPEPVLRYGDYDKEAVNKGVKSPRPYKRPGDYNDPAADQQDDYHEVGKPVVALQQLLTTVGAYSGGIDGWFGDKTKEALGLFQDAAEKGEFIINGTKTEIKEKLSGFRKFVADVLSQEHLKMVVEEKQGKVKSKTGVTKTSENGKQFIMTHEGFREQPYNDTSQNATIGYGTLLHLGPVTDEDKKRFKDGIAQNVARSLLDDAIVDFESALNKAVKVPLNQNQFDALMSWTYNFGPGRLVEEHCTWLKDLNSGYYDKVADGLMLWNKGRMDGEVVEVAGLTKRRKEEGDLFNKPDES